MYFGNSNNNKIAWARSKEKVCFYVIKHTFQANGALLITKSALTIQ